MYFYFNMNRLFTVILLISTVYCVIQSFPKLEDITISKEKRQDKYSCFVKKYHQIKAVVCTYCEVIEDASGYRLTTRYLELLELHFLHDGRVTNVPFRINCSREEQSPSTTTQVMSRTKSIAITLDNKAGIIVVYMDGKSSFSAIQIKPVKDYEINGLHEDTLYQICISVLNKAGESGNYSCVQTKTKQLTDKGSAVAIKNGDPCKNAVTSIKADVTAHNLVKVKWKIEWQGHCQINNLEVRLLEKYSRKCLLLLVLYKRMKIYKTVETDNCRNRKDIRLKSLASGEVLQFWPHSSVRVQSVIVTSHGKFNMNDGDYSSSNLIDTLGNTEEDGEWEKSSKTCYNDCYESNVHYKGLRSLTKSGKLCEKWSESKYSQKSLVINVYRECRTDNGSLGTWIYTPICAYDSNLFSWEYCFVPYCTDYTDKRYGCDDSVKTLSISSTSYSISGKFTSNPQLSNLLYLIVLKKDKWCINYILPGITKSEVKKKMYINIYSFIVACTNGRSKYRKYKEYTFRKLKPHTKYQVYIVPFSEKYDDMKVTYYSQRTKRTKLVRVMSVTGNPVSSSSIQFSWKAPENGYVEIYKCILKQNDEEIKIQTTKQNSIQFDDLTECTEYCVTVTARNNAGSSPVSEVVCGRTFMRKSGRVTEVTVKTVGSSNLNVSWEAPKIFMANDEYRIILRKNDVIKRNQTVKNKSYKFDNLTECMKYCVTVTTINNCGSSPDSEVCERTIARGEGHITFGKIQNFHNLSRKISWSHSTENCVDYYNVRYWKKNKPNNCYELIKTNKTWLNLEQLSPNTQFGVQVKAILKHTSSGQSLSISNTESFQTGNFKDPGRVTSLTVKSVNSSSINVSWKETNIIHFNKIENYIVELIVNHKTIRSYDVNENKSATFDGLDECTEYCVRVTAISNCTRSVSEDFCERTLARGGGNISLGKIQNGADLPINISWTHSWSPNCVDYYIIIFYMQDNKLDSREEHHTNKTFFNMDDLFSNKQYEIQVEAVLSRTEIGNLSVTSNVHSFYTGGVNMPLIVFLCVLVTFSILFGSINVIIWLAQK